MDWDIGVESPAGCCDWSSADAVLSPHTIAPLLMVSNWTGEQGMPARHYYHGQVFMACQPMSAVSIHSPRLVLFI